MLKKVYEVQRIIFQEVIVFIKQKFQETNLRIHQISGLFRSFLILTPYHLDCMYLEPSEYSICVHTSKNLIIIALIVHCSSNCVNLVISTQEIFLIINIIASL